MKRVFSVIMCISFILVLTSCGSDVIQKKYKGNCRAVDCIKKINIENSIAEINTIIGFEGELIDLDYDKYYWKITDDSGLEISYGSDNKRKIRIDYNRDILANRNVDFSKYNEIIYLMESGESLTYDEFVSKIGNVEGTLIEKSQISNKYVWVDSFGEYITAKFSIITNKCTSVSARLNN